MRRNRFITGILAAALVVTMAGVTGCFLQKAPQETTPAAPETSAPAPTVPQTEAVTEMMTTAVATEAETETEVPIEKAEPVIYTVVDGLEVKLSSYDQITAYSGSSTTLTMDGDDVTVEGAGVEVSGRKLVIREAGTYILRGELTNGQIYVRVGEEDKVQLVLDGVSLGCKFSAPIYCDRADKLLITLAAGTKNILTDYLSGTDASAKGCIHSESDVTINGSGSLAIWAAFRHGINCEEDLKIVGGTIEVSAAETGLKGKRSVVFFGGDITITAGEDAVKSNRAEKGYIFATGANLNLTAEDDGLQAEYAIVLRDSDTKVRCFGDTVNCEGITEGTDTIVRWN